MIQDELGSRLIKYRDYPVEFVRDVFNVEIDPWQEEVLRALATNQKVAVAGCRGIGKDFVVSLGIWWYLCVFDFPKIVCTAVKEDVLKDNLWPELSSMMRRSPLIQKLFNFQATKISAKGAEEEWFAVARVAARRSGMGGGAAQAEGLSGRYAKYTLYVIDEASGVDAATFDALEGSANTPNRKMIVIGNPLRRDGRFAKIFLDKKTRSGWWTRNVSYLESKRTSGTKELRAIREAFRDNYGVKSVQWVAGALGQFPDENSDNTVFTRAELDVAASRFIPDDEGLQLQIGVDVSRMGSDETVFYARRGNKSLGMEVKSKIDGVELVRQLLLWVQSFYDNVKDAKKRTYIVVDATGVGSGPVDIMRADGWMVCEVHNGVRSTIPDEFYNLGTELWMVDSKKALRECSIVDDEELLFQLEQRQYEYREGTKQAKLESKREAKKRGLESPDRADAFVLAFADTNKLDIGPADLGRSISFLRY